MPDKIPFTKWQPIGVCDSAESGKMKARIFTHSDFSKIGEMGVNRQNWHQHPQMQKIILRYANDVAKISTLTKRMKRPVVSKINLVGMTLEFQKTPFLNKESYDGKVQLFQIHFVDRPQSQSLWWHWLILLILVIALLGVMTFFIRSSFHFSQDQKFCNLEASNYEKDLNQAHRELDQVFAKYPTLFDDFSSQTSEARLVNRYHKLINDPSITPNQMPKSKVCVKILCKNDQTLCH